MKYLSDYSRQEMSKLLKSKNAFYAFSESQFEDERKDGIEYTSLGNGLFCPVDNAKVLIDEMLSIVDKAIHQDVVENGNLRIISREYFNYESQISCDTSSAEESLQKYKELFPKLFTNEIIKNEFSKCWKIAIEQDLF